MNTAKPRVVTVVGLLGAAAGIMVQRMSGVEMPPVPPGVVILVVPAVLITMLRWRWLPVLGVLAGAAELSGFVAVGAFGDLIRVESLGVTVGAGLRLAGSAAAVLGGLVCLIIGYRRSAASADHKVTTVG